MNLEIWKGLRDLKRDLRRPWHRFAGPADVSSALRAQSRHRAETGEENINFDSRFGSPNLNETSSENLRMTSKIECKMVPESLKFDPLGCLQGFGDSFGAKRALRKSTMRKCKNFHGFWIALGFN